MSDLVCRPLTPSLHHSARDCINGELQTKKPGKKNRARINLPGVIKIPKGFGRPYGLPAGALVGAGLLSVGLESLQPETTIAKTATAKSTTRDIFCFIVAVTFTKTPQSTSTIFTPERRVKPHKTPVVRDQFVFRLSPRAARSFDLLSAHQPSE